MTALNEYFLKQIIDQVEGYLAYLDIEYSTMTLNEQLDALAGIDWDYFAACGVVRGNDSTQNGNGGE
jgi:hypothetical protein